MDGNCIEETKGGRKVKKDFGVKTWLYPMPVLMIATYNEDGSPPRSPRRSRSGWNKEVL